MSTGAGITVRFNSDGNKEVIASAPYGDVNGYSGAGRVVSWQMQSTYLDVDGDVCRRMCRWCRL